MIKYLSENISAIILSGGKSSRMGEDKCDLLYGDVRFIDIQIKKMKSLGIEDIILSGYKGKTDEKVVRDEIMLGPLSGLMLGLKNIINDRAVLLSVDVPLFPEEQILKLINESFSKNNSATIVRHEGIREPLIGIYKKDILPEIEKILLSDNHSMGALLDVIDYDYYDISDKENIFFNVNEKSDYQKLLLNNK